MYAFIYVKTYIYIFYIFIYLYMFLFLLFSLLFLSSSGGLLLCDFEFLNYVFFPVIQDSFTFQSKNFMSGC